MIQCDYNAIGISGEDDAHDRVMRICEAAMALSPRSDIAASAARAPNGGIVGFGGLPLAEKRIPREGLPGGALPEWNRRWRDAIAIGVASPTYSGYLARAAQLLDRLAPALERVLNLIIRGKSVTDEQLAVINSVHEASRDLTPPSIASGKEPGAINPTAVTKLQNLLFAGSADVCRRFHQLPEGAGGFIAWTADLIKDISEIATQETWELIGGAPASLAKMRELLVGVRIIAGDTADGHAHPGITFATLAAKARPDNALRLVASVAETKMKTVLTEMAAVIRSTLDKDGIKAEVHVAEDLAGILPWPPRKVLVVVPVSSLTSLIDVESLVIAVAASRKAVPDGIDLAVVPKIDGRVVPARGVSGHKTLLPLANGTKAWIAELGLPSFDAQISPVLNLAIETASALHSMDRLKLGIAGRPLVELEARDKLEDDLLSARALVTAMVNDLDPEGSALVLPLLDRVRSGEANYAGAVQQFTASQVSDEVMAETSGLLLALDETELRRNGG
ncbi:hypothetical protein [Mesorhizobium salmacidum]|uniref:Uncharacterized protein n=1 Tax=Mesorhizobium salmacidum TaxID=3015171 RepID=A0ABU8L439_9HYPH